MIDGLQQASFGQLHFGEAKLGDQRRTNRLVGLADQLTKHPGGTLPDKLPDPKDTKALYRLMDADDVTHAAVLKPHIDFTQQQIAARDDVVLIIHDGTELDYTKMYSLTDLGQIGNGKHRGFICHNSLAVTEGRQVLGLVNQILHRRAKVSKKETKAQSRKRKDRESRLWVQGAESVQASTPETSTATCVDVCDRGADTFEFLDHERTHQRHFVVRSFHNRSLHVAKDAPKQYLHTEARQWQSQTTREVKISATTGRKARTAMVCISAGPVTLKAPRQKRGEHSNQPLPMHLVRVWAAETPEGKEPLEWFLMTSWPVQTPEDMTRVVEWYLIRWVIEEYHKGQKTGCRIEDMQFTTRDRLEPAIALLSVIAVTLLQLRDASRRPDAKARRATELLCGEYVELLSVWRHKRVHADWSLHDFYYALARLGGHQNRKGDGAPGWLVLWRGWTKLNLMIHGAEAAIKRQKCG